MGMYTDCGKCKNLLSAGGHCYYYDMLTDYDSSSVLYQYYLGKEDATNCPHFESNESSGGCFLTSALVHYLGKADDCKELQTLRHFRDTVLKESREGRRLVCEYYHVAPKIVEAIEASGEKEKHYAFIQETVDTCVKDIEKGDNEGAIEHYYAMVNALKTAFQL